MLIAEYFSSIEKQTINIKDQKYYLIILDSIY